MVRVSTRCSRASPPRRGSSVRRMSSDDTPLPTFLIIGAQKSATRWVAVQPRPAPRRVHRRHRTVVLQQPRNRSRTAVLDAYRAQFTGWHGEPIVGEATPGYMMWRHHPEVVAERIEQVVPDVRLLAVLRNPVDRGAVGDGAPHALRESCARRRSRRIGGANPARNATRSALSRAGGTRPAWRPTWNGSVTGCSSCCTTTSSPTRGRCTNRAGGCTSGASTDFVPPELEQVRFSRQQPGAAPNDGLSIDQRRELFEFFRADVRKLEELLGRDLSAWEPEADHS